MAVLLTQTFESALPCDMTASGTGFLSIDTAKPHRGASCLLITKPVGGTGNHHLRSDVAGAGTECAAFISFMVEDITTVDANHVACFLKLTNFRTTGDGASAIKLYLETKVVSGVTDWILHLRTVDTAGTSVSYNFNFNPLSFGVYHTIAVQAQNMTGANTKVKVILDGDPAINSITGTTLTDAFNTGTDTLRRIQVGFIEASTTDSWTYRVDDLTVADTLAEILLGGEPPIEIPWIAAIPQTDTSVAITCELSRAGTVQLDYGTTTDYGTTVAMTAAADNLHFEKVISGLTAGTVYHYKLTATNTDSETDIQSSEDCYFTTQSQRDTKILVASDIQNFSTRHMPGWSMAQIPNVDLTALLGDVSDINSITGAGIYADKATAQRAELMRNVVIAARPARRGLLAIFGGDHDQDDVTDDLVEFSSHFPIPTTASADKLYYSFDLGYAHIAVFDDLTTITDTQLNWLSADLAATNQVWKILFAHKAGLYSDDDSYGVATPLAGLWTILTDNKVNLWINGSRHISNFVFMNGIWLVTNPSVGQALTTFTNPSSTGHVPGASSYAASRSMIGFSTITITETFIKIRSFNRYGNFSDQRLISKIPRQAVSNRTAAARTSASARTVSIART